MRRNIIIMILFSLLGEFLYSQDDNDSWEFMKFQNYGFSGAGKVGVRFFTTIQDVYNLNESVRWSCTYDYPYKNKYVKETSNTFKCRNGNIIHIGGDNFGSIGDAFYEDTPTESQLKETTENVVSAWNSALADCQSIYYLCSWSYWNESTGSDNDIIEVTFENSSSFWETYFPNQNPNGYGNVAGYKETVGNDNFLNLYYEGNYYDKWERTIVYVNTSISDTYVLDDQEATDGRVNIKRILAHEIGHVLGLGHIGNFYSPSNIQESIMYSNWSNHPTWNSGLSIYDEAFISMLYSESATDFTINVVPDFRNQIHSNYPNPFNPSTTISYSLSDIIQEPKIEIYNIKGQKVKSYTLEDKTGENSIIWQGKDENNRVVSSGVYFYRLLNEGKSVDTKKMLMIK